jgi:hypothetical protein
MRKTSEKDAFDAMRQYIEEFCRPLGGDDELGYLLGAVTNFLWADGLPNVRTEWEDYLAVLARVQRHAIGSHHQARRCKYELTEKEAFRSMLTFLDRQYDRLGPDTMIRPLLDELNALDRNGFDRWQKWPEWLDAIETVKRGEGAR